MKNDGMKWHTEKRRVGDLAPMENNPRQMTAKQDKDLERSLKKFDLVEIPAINTDGIIIAGHQRIRKLLELGRGDEEIDVRVPDKKLSEKDLIEYNIRSNKNTGEFDFDTLPNIADLDDLKDWGFEEWEFGISGDEGEPEPGGGKEGATETLTCPKCGHEFHR
jgi:ParB-like chromosome segregation protein Spo0J